MNKVLLLISGLFVFTLISSQDLKVGNYESDLLERLKSESSGWYHTGVTITMDESIEDNFYKHLLFNSKNPDAMGYRIRIFTSTGNDAAEKARNERARFLSKYDDIGAYMNYSAPDYMVYVGDCRTWSEVLKLYYKIKDDFPNSFPVPQPIKIE